MATRPGAGEMAAVPSPLFKRAVDAYVGGMPIFPRPVSPTSALTDLRDLFSPDRPHRWGILALSLALTSIMLWGFWLDSRSPPKPREIYYVESWMNDRRDSDIIRQQIKDLDDYEAALGKKQVEFQKVADSLGIEWRKEEARNTEQRRAVIAAIHKRLNERLQKAETRESGATSTDTISAR